MNQYRAIILGYIWMPSNVLCSLERTFHAGSHEEAIEKAQTTEAGDFSRVVDVCVYVEQLESCGHYHWSPVKEWDNEETESDYWDTVAD